MKDNLPQVYKNSFFDKVKRFFVNLFAKKEEKQNVEEKVEICKEKKGSNDFKKGLSMSAVTSANHHREEIKSSIIDTVEEKPELLQTMSIDNLKKLIILYEELIKENDKKIKMLKNTI